MYDGTFRILCLPVGTMRGSRVSSEGFQLNSDVFVCVFVCLFCFVFVFVFFWGGGGLLFAVVSFCWGCIFLIDKGIVDPNIPLKAGHHYRTDNSGGGGGCVFIFLVYKGRVDPNIPLKAGHHRTDNGPTLNAGRVAL